jgi:ATP-dependent protease ClpP protease subunit
MKLIPAVTPPAPRAAHGERPRKPFEIRAATTGEAEVLIYTEISYWYMDPEWWIRDLMAITAPVIHVRINSPGGDVWAGVAIYNALVRHGARIIVHVDSLAASIASLIAMAGDEIRMSKGSHMMIHDPLVGTYGNAAYLRKVAGVLEQVGGSMVEIYADRTGVAPEQVAEWMKEEKFFTAKEAREAGLADAEDNTEAIAAKFDLSMYANAPDALKGQAPAAEREKPDTIRKFETGLREELGFSHAEARAIAASGFKAASDPRDEDGGPNRSTTAVQPPPANDPAAEALLASILTARLRLRASAGRR